MNISDIRALTPIVQEYAYFQTSGFSPTLEPVIDEVERWARYQNRAPALPEVYTQMINLFEAARGKVANALGADADEIVLGENATIGINIVANGIDWQPGDNLILSTHEHPGNRIPWYNFVQRYGVQLRFVNVVHDEEQMLHEFEQLIDARTRLVSISHVSRRTGQRLPVKALTEIAHQREVPVLLDGAQSFGAIPVDVHALGCDFYAFSGHKYMMASQGTGGFYVRRDRIEWLKPSWIGSHSQKEMDLDGHMTLLDEAKRFEFGTRNLADQIGFGKALDIWAEIGWANVFAAIAAYTDRLKAALLTVPNLIVETPLPYEQSSGIVTFNIPGIGAAALSARLLDRDHILTSTLEANSDSLRISTHVFNNDEEIARLVAALLRIQESGY
ncbi:MAG: aminotransferase class V-fold PLP-dependent enzyme [Chloroflexi bacterium]|nr:aminotransferase class V-fold PLP-dependent enzyme [Chloroflexota bacterium]